MVENCDKRVWDLKEIILKIISKHPEIQGIYLFGSRRYETNSLRSDIDLLVYTQKAISYRLITDWLHDEYPPIDIFITTDMCNATSIINGSGVSCRDGYESLVDQLDAIKLWGIDIGYDGDFKSWNQTTDQEVNFRMTIIPSPLIPMDIYTTMNNSYEALRQSGIETYFMGATWTDIAISICNIIETAFKKPKNFSRKAKNFAFDKIKIKDEYDFQNFIHLLLRPIVMNIEPENVTIKIDGNDKNADFGISNNKIIIEAKHIKDTSSKSAVIKTIEGLASFYKCNSNVSALVFLVLYEESVELDEVILESTFSKKFDKQPILVRFIKNTYK
jgi:hypothetical protein